MFDNCLLDICEISKDLVSGFLSDWIDAFKRVMYLWHSKSDLANGPSKDDVEDFYVFIYDEEEKDRTQIIRKATYNGQNIGPMQRILGFWCFNAGVGFKKI